MEISHNTGDVTVATFYLMLQCNKIPFISNISTLLLCQDGNYALLNVTHSVPLLTRLGLPVNTAVTANSASRGNGSYSYLLNSSAGNQKVGGSLMNVQDQYPSELLQQVMMCFFCR